MKRRKFLRTIGLATFCGAVACGDTWCADTVREPDIIVKKHSGAIAFSPDSKVLAVANGPVGDKNGICFLDPATGKRYDDFERTTDIPTRLGRGWPPILAFSPDGKYFAAGGEGYIALWETKSGHRLRDLELAQTRTAYGTVTVLAFTPDSRFLFAGGRFWPVGHTEPVRILEDFKGCDGIGFSRDGRQFATRSEGMITLWVYPSLRKEKVFGMKDPSGGPLLFTRDGKHIVSEQVYIGKQPYFFWNITSGEPHFIPFQYKPGFHMDLSPDGTLLATITSRGLAVFAVDTGHAVHLFSSTSVVRDDDMVDLKFAPTQTMLVCSRRSGIRIWKDTNGFKD